MKISVLLQQGDGDFGSSFWLDKEMVVSALKAADFSVDTLLKFHEILESESTEKHQKFLDLLGFSKDEMKYILDRLQSTQNQEA